MQKIIITGCSSGIGFYISNNLCKDYKVIGIARNEPKEKYNFIFNKCDIRDHSSVINFFSEYKKDKEIVGLINLAGVASMNLLSTTPNETIKNIIDTNLLGTIFCTKEIIPSFVRSKKGKIINFSSFATKIGLQGESVYVASKAGVEGFTRSIARELIDFNVTVNCISPGPIETKLTKSIPENYIKKIVDQQIVKEQSNMEDVLNCVKLILSDYANKITGENFIIGGF